jgi:UDP-N-acetylmuramoyl-tripeptide--D-alanyl-D-alanine ligase
LKLREVIGYISGRAPELDPALSEREVTSFVIDSREVKAGDVFFALSQPEYSANGFNGDFADSTAFVRAALDAGAAAAVVREDRYQEFENELKAFRPGLIFVDDCIAALQKLAHAVYLDWNKPVVGITGSAGKTTAKELTATVLEGSARKVLKNIKNYNNGLGHPLTVLNLARDRSFDIAVLEMGMSTPLNEIARLCRITPPDVSVVLNVLAVHVEHLGSIEGVAKAKAEIVEGMKDGGLAVLNADDPRVAAMAKLSKGEVISFGIENDAEIRAESISPAGFGATVFRLITPGGSAEVNLPLSGRHNVMNALAAASVGHHFGMTADAIASALGHAATPPQRGEILRFVNGFTVINDSYNSNPEALLSMARTLVESSPASGRRIIVAGEMLELGDEAAAIHRETGKQIAALGIDLLIGVRGFGRDLAAGAAEAGLSDARFADDSEMAARILADEVRSGDAVLVKGSRGVRTEIVTERLVGKYELAEMVSA